MTCTHHKFDRLYTAHFQRVAGAAWAVEYCRCGARQDHLINPKGGVPEDQPVHVTHAVLNRPEGVMLI